MEAFKTKLYLWEKQLLQENIGHFPCCKSMTTQISTAMCTQFAEKLNVLGAEFTRRFDDFQSKKIDLNYLVIPSKLMLGKAPTKLQMELIEIH